MQNILLGLGAIIIIGGFGVYMMQGEETSDVSVAANEQALQFANDLYNTKQGSEVSDTAIPAQTSSAPTPNQGTIPSTIRNEKIMGATLKTNQGDIVIDFLETDAPNTVANFQKLAKEGFYNGTKFHRVIESFMIQGGDPLSKDDAQSARWGTGGPGYQFADEIHANNRNDIGTISMANAGPNTNGSQFFINVANNNFLDGKHTVFGRVIAGMEVVKKIEATQKGAQDRPTSPIIIESIVFE